MPRISVIMPVYNAEKFIEKTLESILNQTYRDFEIILINDYSTDKSMDIVHKMNNSKIRILENEQNMGIAYSRNIGLDEASGEYIALMDDDDLAPLDRFQKQVDFLDKNQDIDVVGGRYCVIDENDTVIRKLSEPLRNPQYIKASLMFYDPIGNGSTMFRRSFVMKHQIRYQDNCLGMEDYRFWIDCSLHGKITNLDDILLYWRCWKNESARVLENRKEQRRVCYKNIRKYALKKNGFQLENKEFERLLELLPEDYAEYPVTKNELREIYELLQKIASQAEERNLINKEEVKILCRKLFAQRTEFSVLWKK